MSSEYAMRLDYNIIYRQITEKPKTIIFEQQLLASSYSSRNLRIIGSTVPEFKRWCQHISLIKSSSEDEELLMIVSFLKETLWKVSTLRKRTCAVYILQEATVEKIL